MGKIPLIHIGYHKTASSWLQENLFDNPETNFQRFFPQSEIRDRLIMPNALDFKANDVIDYYKSITTEAPSDRISVLSNERLSGNPHSGGYDSKEIADRLKQCFPEAKILIVIREQKSAIASSYTQYLRVGGPCSLEDYLEPSNQNLPTVPLFSYDHFNYLRLIKYYIELFGMGNVLVLPYELFAKDAKAFCSKICNFANSEEIAELPFSKRKNQRISTLSSTLLRQSNKLFAKSRLNPSALDLKKLKQTVRKAFSKDTKKHTNQKESSTEGNSYKKILKFDSFIPPALHAFFDNKLQQIINNKVNDRYKSTNQELSQILKLNLSDYGYDN